MASRCINLTPIRMERTNEHRHSEVEAFSDIELYNELMNRPYTKRLKEEVRRCIQNYRLRNRDILEIGAGVSEFSGLLEDQNRVVLTDLNAKLLRENPRQNRLVVCDATRLPFASDCFDFIYIIGVLHHLQDQRKALVEARRALRNRGSIFICEPHRMSLNFFYYLARLILIEMFGVDFMKRLIGCFSPDESQVDVKYVRQTFQADHQIDIHTILTFRLPPFRLFKNSTVDVRISNLMDRIPVINKLGTTILIEIKPKRRGVDK